MSGERIVVIDDDRALLRALTIGLRARAYDVVTAATGEEGVIQTSLSQPDIIILDMSLPDIDGVDVCRRVRSFSDVPIIVLSALGSEARKVEALDAGADDYVTKPFGMAELEARLRVLLRRTRVHEELIEPTTVIGPLEIDFVHHMSPVQSFWLSSVITYWPGGGAHCTI